MAAAASATAAAIPCADTSECERISPAGAPARPATTAPIAAPPAHPASVPAAATTADSTAEKSTSCQRLAPNQESRRHAASTSRRRLPAARIVNASSSVAASPPSRSSRRADARPSAAAARSGSIGAVTWNTSERALISELRRATLAEKRSISHGWTSPRPIGAIHA